MSTEQVDFWRSNFGDAYHERNQPAVADLTPVLNKMLHRVTPGSVLEPGCGLGVNLLALRALNWWPADGIEPNRAACDQARLQGIPVVNASFLDGILALPGPYDLVLTSGFLIHVPPTEIRETIEEIAGMAEEHVLVIEYWADAESEREYRGNRNVLWARPYGELFERWTKLRVVRYGRADPVLQPGCDWWLLAK